MKHKTAEQPVDARKKRLSFKAMAELLGIRYGTAHFRFKNGYSLSESLLLPVGAPRRTAQVTHGMSDSSEYSIWEGMHLRCRNHPHYVGLGIKVCERWSDFKAFYDDMGPRPTGTSIDRIRGAEGYSPDNCRWATPRQQSQNTSRNINLEWNGEVACVAEWARRTGIKEKAIHQRLERGWPVDKALSLPKSATVIGKKLSDDDVRWIRAHAKSRDPVFGARPLAAKFGVHEVTMARLLRGEIWRHIQ
jgi:hypothetical protein